VGPLPASLLVADDGPIRTVTIDRPERRNALDTPTIEGLLAVVVAASEDPGVRALVLTGSGEVAFSSGFDLKEQEPPDLTPAQALARRARLLDLFRAVDTSEVPVVARVNGVAMGGGVGLALVCDVVVAADHAVFATPEIDVGRWPMAVGAVLLRTAPFRLATEMMMTGRRVGAAEALDAGMVNRVVPPAGLDEATGELARTLAAKPPRTLADGRHTVRRMLDRELGENLELARASLDQVFDSPEAVAGLAAFRSGGVSGVGTNS